MFLCPDLVKLGGLTRCTFYVPKDLVQIQVSPGSWQTMYSNSAALLIEDQVSSFILNKSGIIKKKQLSPGSKAIKCQNYLINKNKKNAFVLEQTVWKPCSSYRSCSVNPNSGWRWQISTVCIDKLISCVVVSTLVSHKIPPEL